ncbi:hypothetical protein [Streptomyces sp. NPDC051162]|uniref:hypothetical protein n=1 Tax=unclassified Streptomyces TaxID=2593676 RepID=UPI00343E7A00
MNEEKDQRRGEGIIPANLDAPIEELEWPKDHGERLALVREKVQPTGDLMPVYVPEAFGGYPLVLYVCEESQTTGPCEGNLRASLMVTRITDEMYPIYGTTLGVLIAPGGTELGFSDGEIQKLRLLAAP